MCSLFGFELSARQGQGEMLDGDSGRKAGTDVVVRKSDSVANGLSSMGVQRILVLRYANTIDMSESNTQCKLR